MKRSYKLKVIVFFSSFFFTVAQAQTSLENSEIEENIVSNVGPFAVVELNIVDLFFSRGRVYSEYVALDGLAFGFSLEHERLRGYNLKFDSWSLGSSLSQYLQNLSLRGLFLRGETGVLVANYSIETKAAEIPVKYNNISVYADFLSGYRYAFSKSCSVEFGIGLRRIIPDFFTIKPTKSGIILSENISLWQFRGDLALGITL